MHLVSSVLLLFFFFFNLENVFTREAIIPTFGEKNGSSNTLNHLS